MPWTNRSQAWRRRSPVIGRPRRTIDSSARSASRSLVTVRQGPGRSGVVVRLPEREFDGAIGDGERAHAGIGERGRGLVVELRAPGGVVPHGTDELGKRRSAV
ncbi:MAG: hypothetical protein HND58_17895 [Planctomycetota bacterium]|nr:MAG: hypothetical protein HND58_17895 [Planctomycetota bacterium]